MRRQLFLFTSPDSTLIWQHWCLFFLAYSIFLFFPSDILKMKNYVTTPHFTIVHDGKFQSWKERSVCSFFSFFFFIWLGWKKKWGFLNSFFIYFLFFSTSNHPPKKKKKRKERYENEKWSLLFHHHIFFASFRNDLRYCDDDI